MMKPSQSGFSPAFLRVVILLAFLLAPTGQGVFGQALPAAEASPISTGFALPTTLGSLQYAVSASQSLIWGYYTNQGAAAMTNVTGDVAYLSNSKLHPFSMVFSGGHSFSETGQASYSYLNLGFSQVANVGRWNMVVSDNVSYMPGTPTTSLSGVPGVGDLGVSPVQGSGNTGQGVLTAYSNRISNDAAGSIQRQITGKTSLSASGSYNTMRFFSTTSNPANVSTAGLDNNSVTGAGGFSHQLDARTSYGGSYTYSLYMYSGNNFGVATPDFSSQTLSGTFSHHLTRKLTVTASAGPQWTASSAIGGNSALSLFVDASASYAARSFGTSAAFTRSSNNGYGALAGAISDSAVFSINRRFAVVWSCAATSAYTHTSTLNLASIVPYSVDTFTQAAQISRAIVRNLSGYASYTFQNQSSSGAGSGAVDVFSGTSQVVGFGLTYSPSSLHLGRR